MIIKPKNSIDPNDHPRHIASSSGPASKRGFVRHKSLGIDGKRGWEPWNHPKHPKIKHCLFQQKLTCWWYYFENGGIEDEISARKKPLGTLHLASCIIFFEFPARIMQFIGMLPPSRERNMTSQIKAFYMTCQADFKRNQKGDGIKCTFLSRWGCIEISSFERKSQAKSSLPWIQIIGNKHTIT